MTDEPFLLRQPLWYAKTNRSESRWDLAIVESDPGTEEAVQVRMGVSHNEDREIGKEDGHWIRVGDIDGAEQGTNERNRMVAIATSTDSRWSRVALVCGAGLGKTTNLRWLESRINRLDEGRNPNLAIFWELHELAKLNSDSLVKAAVIARLSPEENDRQRMETAVDRMLRDGRIVFLLDSLDQAGPDPQGPVVKALETLATGPWKRCRIWISGRPYAFREARDGLTNIDRSTPWEFFRVGPLDEAEACQLIESLSPARK